MKIACKFDGMALPQHNLLFVTANIFQEVDDQVAEELLKFSYFYSDTPKKVFVKKRLSESFVKYEEEGEQ